MATGGRPGDDPNGIKARQRHDIHHGQPFEIQGIGTGEDKVASQHGGKEGWQRQAQEGPARQQYGNQDQPPEEGQVARGEGAPAFARVPTIVWQIEEVIEQID